MMRPAMMVAVVTGLSGCVASNSTPGAVSYTCAGGQALTAVYGTEGEMAKVDITFSGGTYLLYAEPAASGARYGWPSDGTNYVWLTKGREGALYLKDGSAGGAETPVLTGCVQS